MTPEHPTDKQYRWWLDPRWIFLILVVATAVLIVWGLFGLEPRLIVSRETTYITEPLRPDGTPDYAAYVLDRMGRGTPPEENAAVALLHATWPMELDPADLAAVCKALGIPETPPTFVALGSADGDKVLREELRAFLELAAHDGRVAMHAAPEGDSRVLDLIDNARSIAWSSQDCPPLAAWIKRQSPALDHVVEGANRPKYELPPPSLQRDTPEAVLAADMMFDLTSLRRASRELIARAMLHLGEGRLQEAWRDIRAVHRLARLIAPAERPRFVVTQLVARALEGMANIATVTLLDSPLLSGAMAASIRRDLESLPPLPNVASSCLMERLLFIELMVASTRFRASERARLWSSLVDDDLAWLLGTSLDMNAVLRDINSHWDRVEAAFSLPSHAERCLAADQIAADMAASLSMPGGWQKAAWYAQAGVNRRIRSTVLARIVMNEPGSWYTGVLNAYERFKANAAVVRLAAALAEHRDRGLGGEGKPYPDALDELVPKVLDAVPNDPCSGKPFHYERRGEGYLLYSVGADGVDDGGTNGELDKGEWRSSDNKADSLDQDIAIRLPLPKRSFIPPEKDAGN